VEEFGKEEEERRGSCDEEEMLSSCSVFTSGSESDECEKSPKSCQIPKQNAHM
jgi:hypothetical protein